MKKAMIAILAAFTVSVGTFAVPAYADYYTENKTLYQGMESSDVSDLQNDLKVLGYFGYGTTGYFGNLTKQAVAVYQKNNSLTADGIVGHSTAREIKIDTVIKNAKQYMGVPYVWGGTSPGGFDCSGFTHYVFLKNDIVIPRTSSLQYEEGISIPKDRLKPGDLVFFSTYKPGPSHVGIYLGDGQFIHASSGAEQVTISDLNKSYYVQRYIGARRIIN